MKLRALAKINLGLDVIGRLDNGYHEVRMIMQTINMYDQIQMKKSRKPGIRITTNLSYVPTNENNLVYKAAIMLIEEFQIKQGVDIELYKVIPVAAGMAGGSADAAATLIGMNRLFKLNLSNQELMDRGVRIGADIPYCIMRGTALAEGIGEELSPLSPMMDCFILIGKPSISVSTKYVYEALDAKEITNHPNIDGIIRALEDRDLKGLCSGMGNVLEEVTVERHPIITQIKNHMLEYGAVGAMMSGSGPTVFGIYDDEKKAKVAYEALKESQLARQVFLTTPYNKRGSTNDNRINIEYG